MIIRMILIHPVCGNGRLLNGRLGLQFLLRTWATPLHPLQSNTYTRNTNC